MKWRMLFGGLIILAASTLIVHIGRQTRATNDNLVARNEVSIKIAIIDYQINHGPPPSNIDQIVSTLPNERKLMNPFTGKYTEPSTRRYVPGANVVPFPIDTTRYVVESYDGSGKLLRPKPMRF